jgi:TatA/E family protein of Tat protein translocase
VFGIGVQEIVVILVIALLVFGPKRLPELARSLGRGLNEFRRASTDLRRTLTDTMEEPTIDPPSRTKAPPAGETPETSGDAEPPAKPPETSGG